MDGKIGSGDGDFGLHLAWLRMSNGLTQAMLAERTGLSARCISDLERGINAAPRLDTINKLSEGLDLSIEQRRQMLVVAARARLGLRKARLAGRRA